MVRQAGNDCHGGRSLPLQIPRNRSMAPHIGGPRGEALQWIGGQKEPRKAGARVYCDFCEKEWARQGKACKQV